MTINDFKHLHDSYQKMIVRFINSKNASLVMKYLLRKILLPLIIVIIKAEVIIISVPKFSEDTVVKAFKEFGAGVFLASFKTKHTRVKLRYVWLLTINFGTRTSYTCRLCFSIDNAELLPGKSSFSFSLLA